MFCASLAAGSASLAAGSVSSGGLLPRAVVISDQKFVDKTGQPVLLQGANVVMKGPPWLPPVSGDDVCADRWFSNFTCYTFNRADAEHITQTMGWNYIRLGVTWAGAQPTAEHKLDEEWVTRLHAILSLCEEYGIHVVLDLHQDAVGTATCGEGVPQWFSALATPHQIGKPLVPLLPGVLRSSNFPTPQHACISACRASFVDRFASEAVRRTMRNERHRVVGPACG